MQIRWREHEIIFVTILVVIQLILCVYHPENITQHVPDLKNIFESNDASFIYGRNVLLPQIASLLIAYFGYLSINMIILPSLKKISFSDFEKLLTLNIVKVVLAIVFTSYLLAIGANAICYWAKPYLFNYAGYQLLALFGFNANPLIDLFFGFSNSLLLVISVAALAGLREMIIWLINKPDKKRDFRVLITNNITPLVFFYLLVLVIINPIHETFLNYFAFVTPVFFIYIYTTFWLFPFKGEGTFASRRVLIRLMLSTITATLPAVFIFVERGPFLKFFFYWLFLLLVAVPLSWLLYQQRKEKILQLRGMETALARSAADLQFLRSQINPHFLFNALNTLYGTALKESADHTAEGIQKLGDMMRFMLHENNLDVISMDKEIEYLKNYISLQKLRTQSSADIIIEDNIDEVICKRNIAPMLLIPFIENAFKHGISLVEKSWIIIKLECAGTAINFEVSNSTHVRNENDTEKNKSGIGLKNVAQRLEFLYPGKHELTVHQDNNEFIIKLFLQ